MHQLFVHLIVSQYSIHFRNGTDQVSANFKLLADKLNCKYDKFIRTTDKKHEACVQYLWKALEERNKIYLGAYEGWYSGRDEAFYDESELVNGMAPTDLAN